MDSNRDFFDYQDTGKPRSRTLGTPPRDSLLRDANILPCRLRSEAVTVISSDEDEVKEQDASEYDEYYWIIFCDNICINKSSCGSKVDQ